MKSGTKVTVLLLGCAALIVGAIVLTPAARREQAKRGTARSWSHISGDLFADNMALDERRKYVRHDGTTLPTVTAWAGEFQKVEGVVHFISQTEAGHPVVWVSNSAGKKEDYVLSCEADEPRDTSGLVVGEPITVWGIGAETARYGHGNVLVRDVEGGTEMKAWYSLVLEDCEW